MKAKPSYTAVMMEAKDGTYTGYIEEIPGVISQGDTLEELRENLLDALKMMIRYYKDESGKLFRKSSTQNRKKEILTIG